MGNETTAVPGRSRQALDDAYACPRCDTRKFPHELCAEHRCSALTRQGTPCSRSRTHLELGVCGIHAREKPEPEMAGHLRRLAGKDDTQARVIRRLADVPRDLGAAETFQAELTISSDEFLAEVLRSDGDRGAQMRAAGFTALAAALGL